MEPTQIRLTIPDSVDPTRLMGPADSLLRRIEQAFDAMVVVRGNTITISGAIEVVEQASTVFSRLMGRADDSIPNFPLYIIIGNTAFNLMSDSTSRGLMSIIEASSLLKKVKINRWVFPVQKVLFAVVNYAFSLIAVVLVMIFVQYAPSVYALYVIPGLFMLSVFCIGLSLFLSCAAVFFRDVIHLWSVFLTAWTYLTPMFYSIKILPEWLQTLESFNPMYLYLTYLRDALLFRVNPSLELTLGCAGFAVASLVIGYLVFRRHESKFILYI